MLDDAKQIHETLTALENALDEKPVNARKARALAGRLHQQLHDGVAKHAALLPPDVVAFSGGTPKPPR